MTPEAETVKACTPGLEARYRNLGPGTFKPGFAVSLVNSSFRGGSSPTNLSLTRTRTRAHTADSRIDPNGRPAPDDFSPPLPRPRIIERMDTGLRPRLIWVSVRRDLVNPRWSALGRFNLTHLSALDRPLSLHHDAMI